MAIGNVYTLAIQGRMHGQTILNILHYQQILANDTPEFSLITAFRAAVETALLACMSDEYRLQGYLAQKVWPLPIFAAYSSPLLDLPGTVAEEALPTSVAAVITKKTELAGPAYRGRVYLAGVPVTFEDNSTINATGMLKYTSLGNELQVPVLFDDDPFMDPVIYHRTTHLTDPIVKCQARNILRNQRRRQVGVGI